MGNHRVLLYFTLCFIIYMIWAQWQMDYGPKPEPVLATDSNREISENLTAEDIPQAVRSTTQEQFEGQSQGQLTAPVVKEVTTNSERIKVVTDILDIEIDTKGGDIRRTVLRNYSETADQPENKLVLMTDENINFFVAQSGLVSVNKETAPSHNAIYRSEQNVYRLAEGEDTIEVPLYWQGSNGVKIKKVLTFNTTISYKPTSNHNH